jgi:hypothetical protein
VQGEQLGAQSERLGALEEQAAAEHAQKDRLKVLRKELVRAHSSVVCDLRSYRRITSPKTLWSSISS